MEAERNEIIARVGRGELTPDEALRLLDLLEEQEAEAANDAGATGGPGAGGHTYELPPRTQALPPPRPGHVKKLRVHMAAGKVRIVGDPTVAGVEADGPHTMREEGDTLVVDCEPLGGARETENEHGFVLLGSGRRRAPLRIPWEAPRAVRIRAHPELELDCEVVAGSAAVDGMTGPIHVDLSGGSLALRGVRSPIDCSVSAGSVSISGLLREGESKVNCDMGSVAVRLEPGSSVRVRAGVTMGKATVRVGERRDDEWVVGGGAGVLNVTGTMASVAVSEG
jgi:hypothetical protein